jgi:ethanolamine ammonia-lyase large subunit
MVNNVTGFIGPETHLDSFEMMLANLQDHFLGKLLGLPMGMAPCYTLHSRTILEGQQIATQLLTAAGANYFMDVCLNTDRMLAYFDTSAHDVQTLREIYGRAPAPEYLEWAIGRGILQRDADGSVRRGPQWGRPEQFCDSPDEFAELARRTPAFYGLETAGPRPANSVMRRVKLNQGAARAAIHSELRFDELQRIANFRVLETTAKDKETHLNSPDAGARLSAASRARLSPECTQVQIVVSDGLSAEAVHHNLPDLLPTLVDGLTSHNVNQGRPIAVRYGRVKLAEQIADALECELVVFLVGERPGGDALASRSLSAYLVYRLSGAALAEAARFSGNSHARWEQTVISNIYSAGLPPVEAGAVILEKVLQILAHRAAGNRLLALLGSPAAGT